MTIVEMLKAMGSSDERMSRAVWNNRAFIEVDHNSGRMFLTVANIVYAKPWIADCWDLMADDWNFWELPDEDA